MVIYNDEEMGFQEDIANVSEELQIKIISWFLVKVLIYILKRLIIIMNGPKKHWGLLINDIIKFYLSLT